MIKFSRWVNRLHSGFIIYLLTGFLIKSQRSVLVLVIPTLQFQFLTNNNKCIMTQLENKLIEIEDANDKDKKDEDKKDEDEKDGDDKDKKDVKKEPVSFIDKKMKEFNINISPDNQERLVNCILYGSFLLNYFL